MRTMTGSNHGVDVGGLAAGILHASMNIDRRMLICCQAKKKTALGIAKQRRLALTMAAFELAINESREQKADGFWRDIRVARCALSALNPEWQCLSPNITFAAQL